MTHSVVFEIFAIKKSWQLYVLFPQINVYKIYKMSSEYSFVNELFSIMFTNYYVPTKLR